MQTVEGLTQRIDVKFKVVPTSCTSQLSFGVFVVFSFLIIFVRAQCEWIKYVFYEPYLTITHIDRPTNTKNESILRNFYY